MKEITEMLKTHLISSQMERAMDINLIRDPFSTWTLTTDIPALINCSVGWGLEA